MLSVSLTHGHATLESRRVRARLHLASCTLRHLSGDVDAARQFGVNVLRGHGLSLKLARDAGANGDSPRTAPPSRASFELLRNESAAVAVRLRCEVDLGGGGWRLEHWIEAELRGDEPSLRMRLGGTVLGPAVGGAASAPQPSGPRALLYSMSLRPRSLYAAMPSAGLIQMLVAGGGRGGGRAAARAAAREALRLQHAASGRRRRTRRRGGDRRRSGAALEGAAAAAALAEEQGDERAEAEEVASQPSLRHLTSSEAPLRVHAIGLLHPPQQPSTSPPPPPPPLSSSPGGLAVELSDLLCSGSGGLGRASILLASAAGTALQLPFAPSASTASPIASAAAAQQWRLGDPWAITTSDPAGSSSSSSSSTAAAAASATTAQGHSAGPSPLQAGAAWGCTLQLSPANADFPAARAGASLAGVSRRDAAAFLSATYASVAGQFAGTHAGGGRGSAGLVSPTLRSPGSRYKAWLNFWDPDSFWTVSVLSASSDPLLWSEARRVLERTGALQRASGQLPRKLDARAATRGKPPVPVWDPYRNQFGHWTPLMTGPNLFWPLAAMRYAAEAGAAGAAWLRRWMGTVRRALAFLLSYARPMRPPGVGGDDHGGAGDAGDVFGGGAIAPIQQCVPAQRLPEGWPSSNNVSLDGSFSTCRQAAAATREAAAAVAAAAAAVATTQQTTPERSEKGHTGGGPLVLWAPGPLWNVPFVKGNATAESHIVLIHALRTVRRAHKPHTPEHHHIDTFGVHTHRLRLPRRGSLGTRAALRRCAASRTDCSEGSTSGCGTSAPADTCPSATRPRHQHRTRRFSRSSRSSASGCRRHVARRHQQRSTTGTSTPTFWRSRCASRRRAAPP